MTHLPPALMLLEAVGALSVPVSLATLGMVSLVQVHYVWAVKYIAHVVTSKESRSIKVAAHSY